MALRCSVFVATSLDGFLARPDGRLDWLSLVERPGEDYGYAAFFETVDTLVVGRKTYDVVRAFDRWPWQGKRCVVMTHASLASSHGEEFHAGGVLDLVERLEREGSERVYVDGGSVIQQFLAAGRIDDLTLSIVPVLLGEGVRLFGNLASDVRLELVANRSFPSGLVQNEYRVQTR